MKLGNVKANVWLWAEEEYLKTVCIYREMFCVISAMLMICVC